MGQTIDEIEVHTLESEFPAPLDDLAGHRLRLDAIHRFLHAFVEVLDSHADPVESIVTQRLEMRPRQPARINLATELPFLVAGEIEPTAKVRGQRRDLLGLVVGRRSPTPVQLLDATPVGNDLCNAVDLPIEILQIASLLVGFLRNDHGASAEIAQLVTERQVRIN